MTSDDTRPCDECDATMELVDDSSTRRKYECVECDYFLINIKDDWSLGEPDPNACPGCGDVGDGDDVLANDQRWCPKTPDDCRVVSYHAPDTE